VVRLNVGRLPAKTVIVCTDRAEVKRLVRVDCLEPGVSQIQIDVFCRKK
jgi:hypothetical protein